VSGDNGFGVTVEVTVSNEVGVAVIELDVVLEPRFLKGPIRGMGMRDWFL
jgi:hypothetical protein